VSITSSGMVNALFMQPGQTIIEFSTPLIVASPTISKFRENVKGLLEDSDVEVAQEIHMFYKTLAFLKNHNYVSINNAGRTTKEIVDGITRDPYMKAFMNRNE
jgi:hypothetical protein